MHLDCSKENTDSENRNSVLPNFFWDIEFDRAIQDLYEQGWFDERGVKKHKSGLSIKFLIPPTPTWYDDP
jgi:hypothetical protein